VLLLAVWPLSRWLALTVAEALLPPTPARTESAAIWREIWQRRGEWVVGYVADRPKSMAEPQTSMNR
ncbi:MAG: hypothetical protein ABL904_14570, partial [Hyphomicrobiaceae bacterium]